VYDSTRANQIFLQVRAAQGGGPGTGAGGSGTGAGGSGTGGGGLGTGGGGSRPGGPGGPGGAATSFTSLLEFYMRSGMTAEEFAQIEPSLTATINIQSLVNVNTASETVLTSIPGIGTDKA